MTSANINGIKCLTCKRLVSNGSKQCPACKKAAGMKKEMLKNESAVEGVDYLVCHLCHPDVNFFKRMTKFHAEKHGFESIQEFHEKTGIKKCCDSHKEIRDAKNPWKNHGGKCSVYSDKNPNFSAEKKEAARLKNKASHSKQEVKEKNIFRIEYWNKLYPDDPEKARSEYAKSQTRDKEYFINKFGPEDGLKKWQDKRDGWMKTMRSKPECEKIDINSRKIRKSFSSTSLAETEIREYLINHGFGVLDQYSLFKGHSNGKDRVYVYDFQYGNKIIEYYGDYWHANPILYDIDMMHPTMKMTSSDIWSRDQEKINYAIQNGFEVLIIWERDFNTRKQEVLKECIAFLSK